MSQSSAQWNAFIEEVIEHKSVWTIKDEGGVSTSTNVDDETSMPFWSLKSRAEKIINNVPAYNGFRPFEIILNDFISRWLTGTRGQVLCPSIFWKLEQCTCPSVPFLVAAFFHFYITRRKGNYKTTLLAHHIDTSEEMKRTLAMGLYLRFKKEDPNDPNSGKYSGIYIKQDPLTFGSL
jgi:hypothetical protein